VKRYLTAILLLSVLFLLPSCKQEKPADKIVVAATILPVADFVRNIGGDKVEVFAMAPPGADPHTYEPTPTQLKKLASAELYAKTGSGIDFELVWMDNIAKNNPGMTIADCSRGIELIAAEGDDHDLTVTKNSPFSGKDSHIWLSPKNAVIMVDNICNALIKSDPANKDYYLKNKIGYVKKLESLDQEARERIKSINNKTFIVYHPAWGYLAREYGLKQLSVEIEGKQPSAKEIARLIDTAKKNKVKVVFVSPQFNSKSAEIIAREINGRVILIDPCSVPYIDNVKLFLKNIG